MQSAAVLTPMPGKAAGRICEGRLRECMALPGFALRVDAPDSGAMKKRRRSVNEEEQSCHSAAWSVFVGNMPSESGRRN